MSDKDYVDRFAKPATTKMFFFFDKDQLLENLVVDPETPRIKKIVLPRNTFITVADTTFSLQYPIEIRQMAHGGLQVVWDVSQTSPLKLQSTNVIEWQILKNDDGQEYVAFQVDVEQFSITSKSAPVSVSTGFSSNIEITQQYYYCRVWIDNGDGASPRFVEMKTTHTDEIYDPRVPTAVIRVLDGMVNIKIPQIYMSLGMLDKSIRMDVYETAGPMNLDLRNYPPDQFIANFRAVDKSEENDFVAPLLS